MPFPDTLTPLEAQARDQLAGQTPYEALLFHAWLATRLDTYHKLATAVRLGTGEDPGPGYPDYARRYAVLTTQRKADVVAFRGNTVDIWEIKIQGNLGALGQLHGYRHLWLEEFPTWPVDRLGVICHHLTADVWRVLTAAGVVVVTLPEVNLPGVGGVQLTAPEG